MRGLKAVEARDRRYQWRRAGRRTRAGTGMRPADRFGECHVRLSRSIAGTYPRLGRYTEYHQGGTCCHCSGAFITGPANKRRKGCPGRTGKQGGPPYRSYDSSQKHGVELCKSAPLAIRVAKQALIQGLRPSAGKGPGTGEIAERLSGYNGRFR